MRYGLREAMDITIFDTKGNLVVELDTLKETYLKLENGYCAIETNDALLNDKLLLFLGTEEKQELSDFEKYAQSNKNKKTIVFNSSDMKECKIITKTILQKDTSTIEDNKYIDEYSVWTFEIPKAYIRNNFLLKCSPKGKPASHPFKFEIQEYNDKGDMFKLHIEE